MLDLISQIKATKTNEPIYLDSKVLFEGIVDTVSGHCRRHGFNISTVLSRKNRGSTIQEALSKGKHEPVLYVVDGISDTLTNHCRRLKLNIRTIYARLKRLPVQEAFYPKKPCGHEYTIDGVKALLTEHSVRLGISVTGLRYKTKRFPLDSDIPSKELRKNVKPTKPNQSQREVKPT